MPLNTITLNDTAIEIAAGNFTAIDAQAAAEGEAIEQLRRMVPHRRPFGDHVRVELQLRPRLSIAMQRQVQL